MEGYKGNKTFGKDKYLTHDSPEVSKEELKRFDRIVGLKKYGNQLNPVTTHNIYRTMKSNKNWTDAEIRELQHIPKDPWLTTERRKKKRTRKTPNPHTK
mgnify:CR=1 FL=1